ncbi:LysM peptidoglycan-binding domain-containing protein [Sphingopyxis fribergensis]
MASAIRELAKGTSPSSTYSLQPDHRAQLFNQTGKSEWSIGDRLTGVGIRTRKFPAMDRRALHGSLVRRFMTPAEQLPEKEDYRPASLEHFWGTLAEMGASADNALETLGQKLATAGDERALRAPARVRSYVVQPGDTLRGIAAEQMKEAGSWQILALHNKNVGLLFEDDELYAGAKLEIPEYEVVKPAV